MRPWSLVVIVGSLVACEVGGGEVVETSATVSYTDLEGGVWYLRARDGALYVPARIPDAFRVAGLRVEVRVEVRRNTATGYQFGTPVELLSIEQLDEGACRDVGCAPCAPPHAVVTVSDATTGGPVADAVVTGGGVTWTCSEVNGKTACVHPGYLFAEPDLYTSWAPVPLTVSALGYVSATTRVITLPPGPTPPGQCCGSCWTFETAPVSLALQ